MEERFIDIEIKLANLENLVEQLNAIIYDQQKKVDKMEKILMEYELNQSSDIGPHKVKPPHY